MSQKIRRSLAVASLGVALFLVAPVPSEAAGWRESGMGSLFERAWRWMEIFVPGRPDSSREKLGHGIDPNGEPTADSTPTGDQGVMIDPDGLK
ncbi:MAG TPA: hypothetical protein VL025_14895 [Thermoanaerobaculia bacterium]|nr:hypothetical protein [Thermoanaerobaculia bacterium]